MTQLIPAVNNYDHLYGDPSAALELVEYGDYECPFCGRAYPMIKSIQHELGPDLKFVFRNFPLKKIHPHAFLAAVATEAAALQNKFWEMHDIIFENQWRLDISSILHFAASIGLDMGSFKNDIRQKTLMEKVDRDFESGLKSMVNKTPTFFINGTRYDGEWTGDQLFQHLKGLLAQIAIS